MTPQEMLKTRVDSRLELHDPRRRHADRHESNIHGFRSVLLHKAGILCQPRTEETPLLYRSRAARANLVPTLM